VTSDEARTQGRLLRNFVPPLAPLVGRARESVELTALLEAHKLVTLVAPSGMGKTRLVLAVARQVSFPDGVAFVPLAEGMTTPQLVAAIADALGFTFHNEQHPAQQLTDYLRDKRMLLILDHLQAVSDESLRLLTALAAGAATLLVTAWERLNVTGDAVYPLLPLAPDGALELFAQTAPPTFQLDRSNREAVLRLCARVGFIPLGILLTAAWVDVLPLDEIEAEIAANPSFLHADWRDLPPRHHSLDAVMAATWSHLNQAEKQAFARLSVFRGGWTRAASNAVGVTLNDLRALMNRALVWRDAGRYYTHEPLRQFAERQFVDEGVRAAHAAYFAALTAAQRERLQGHGQDDALRTLTADWDNIHAVCEYLRDEALAPMLEPLAIAYNAGSKWEAGAAFFARIQAALTPSPAWAEAALWAAWLRLLASNSATDDAALLCDLRASTVQAAAIIVGQREKLDALACYIDGYLHAVSRDFPRSVETLQDAADRYLRCGSRYFAAQVYHLLGYVHIQLHDEAGALAYAEQCVAISREIGDLNGLSMYLINYGSFLMWQGRFAEAYRAFEESLHYGQTQGNWSRVLWAEQCLGSLAFYAADFASVRASALRVLEMAGQYGYHAAREFGIQNLHIAALAMGDYAEARRLYAEADFLSPGERAFGLALAEIGLGNLSAARDYLLTILLDSESQRKIYALGGAAVVLAGQGDLQRAAVLLSLVWHSSLRGRHFIERIPLFNNLRLYLEQKIPPHLFAEAWTRGQQAELSLAIPELAYHLGARDVPRLPLTAQALPVTLSARELEILRLIGQGLTNEAIARELVISLSTVKKHITHIYDKLGVTNRTQALLRARELGLDSPPSSTFG
jgi:predicted ATPase/DNA-binding CsgD family transcriptional regulator